MADTKAVKPLARPQLVQVTPARRVEARDVDGSHEGSLEAWRAGSGAWRAYVRYSVGVGSVRLGWVDSGDVRPV